MYLRTGESFVTEEVLSMPYTASSSGYLSNHVKVPSSQFLTACCGNSVRHEFWRRAKCGAKFPLPPGEGKGEGVQ
jgi:hypothetical protein